jgi:predicted TIM-barrel fold metal-dependent hydrolase
MGVPYVHECGFLGKNYPNVYLNLCWSHIIAPEMIVRAIAEMLDYVPTNKVFGFGGDFLYNPEQTWGALQIAKENLSEVFARKVERGMMGVDEAEEILRLWLYENPAKAYGLQEGA